MAHLLQQPPVAGRARAPQQRRTTPRSRTPAAAARAPTQSTAQTTCIGSRSILAAPRDAPWLQGPSMSRCTPLDHCMPPPGGMQGAVLVRVLVGVPGTRQHRGARVGTQALPQEHQHCAHSCGASHSMATSKLPPEPQSSSLARGTAGRERCQQRTGSRRDPGGHP